MGEETLRKEGVARFLKGERASLICQALGRSRPWLYKWLRRYRSGDSEWDQSRSRIPRRIAVKTSLEIEQVVSSVRTRLVTTKYAQRGAVAIRWELERLGIQPVPEIWTINRILKRNGLLAKPDYEPRGKLYPALAIRSPSEVQQLDLVGPRYLERGARFYGVHLIDSFSNAVALAALSSKRDAEVVEAVVAAWQRLGIPKVLQMDNELSLRGSNRYPRSFGLLIRLCFYLGVEPLFIPAGEPWRNGIIERFNDVYDKLFFRSQRFRNLEHLRDELFQFEAFHNSQHRYGKLGQRTPRQVHTVIPSRMLSKDFKLHRQVIPWRDGWVSFIRLTDSEGRIRFFGQTFLVDRGLVHEYVKGTIYTKTGLLKVFHQGHLTKVIDYPVTRTKL